MTQAGSTSQWDYFLRNLGAWEGSFTKLSAQGEVLADTPTLVTFEGSENNTLVRQTVDRFSADRTQIIQHQELEYQSLGRNILMFETGAFSQGSIQFAPFTEFGGELGFLWGKHRLRLVELFNASQEFASVTVIREHLQGTPPRDRPPLTIEQLVGTWRGDAVTMYPDWRSEQYSTTLSIQREGDRLQQRLTLPQMELASSAQISGDRLLFDEGVQVLMLPDGASATTPLTIPRGKPFFIEAGWLIEPDLRQRMIRNYDAQGSWSGLTLVTERRDG